MYRLLTTNRFNKQLSKLDKSIQKIIVKWINKNINNTTDPRLNGKQLQGNWSNYWRYRIGEYRIIAEIKDDELIIIAVTLGHRKDIYNKFD